jgi:hypothetical protein
MRLTRRAVLVASLLCLLVPAIARADFGTLYRDYTADSAIDGCKYSASELRAGLGQIPADVRQYDPQFELALESALEQRLGGCKAAATGPAGNRGIKTVADGSPSPRSLHPAPLAAVATDDGTPAVVVAMIVLLAAVLALAAILGLAGYFGWSVDEASAPLRNGSRRLAERASDRLYAVRDRLGF